MKNIQYDYEKELKVTFYNKANIGISKVKCKRQPDYFYKYTMFNIKTKEIIDTYYLNH